MVTEQLVEILKKIAKAKGVSYQMIASSLKMSESSIKRQFSKGTFTLERFVEICNLLDLSLADISELLEKESSSKVHTYTDEQEKLFLKSPKTLAFFDQLINLGSVKRVSKKFSIGVKEETKYLSQLEKVGLLEWLPNNKAKILVSKNVSWQRDGKLRQYLFSKAKDEFLKNSFKIKNSTEGLHSLTLSEDSYKKVSVKIEELIQEAVEQENYDSLLKSKRKPYGLYVGIRPWSFSVLENF